MCRLFCVPGGYRPGSGCQETLAFRVLRQCRGGPVSWLRASQETQSHAPTPNVFMGQPYYGESERESNPPRQPQGCRQRF